MFINQIIDIAINQPNKIAVSYGDKKITYHKLYAKASCVATYLRDKGLTPGDKVILYHARNIDLIVKILGVFLAECIYIPVDIKFPKGRLHEIQKEVGQSLIFDDHTKIAYQEEILYKYNPLRNNNETSYILFTSGSTGKPKGVCLTQKNLSSFIEWTQNFFDSESLSKTLFSTSISFDLSLFEIFAPLVAGGEIVLVENALSLLDDDVQVTLINTVPSALKSLIEGARIPQGTKIINVAGEALRQSLVDLAYQSNIDKIYNLYGPTECTTYATVWHAIKNDQSNDVPIGFPISNANVVITDDNLNILQQGEKGEILIGGSCVGLGYFNNKELTSQKFVILNGDRFYKTGDIGFFNEDSCLIYCGRKDNQIKLRGFRIELEEIESRISLIKDVKKTAVIYCPSKEKIYAFVVCELSQEIIKSLLSDTLPDYMLPTIIKIDNLPLNNSGKIDRSKLKEMVDHIDRSESKSGHDNVLEIISNILKIETSKLDLDKSFFELGGDSLLATRFLFEVQKAFNIKLIFRDIMSSINIRELINKIKDQKRRLYPWENKFITFEEINPKTGAYILAYAFKYQKGFSFVQLKEAFTKLVRAFPILKTQYIKVDSKIFAVEQDAEVVKEIEEESQEALSKFAFQPFNFFESPLIRLGFVNETIVFACHHILLDGFSITNIIQSFIKLLSGKTITSQTIKLWQTDANELNYWLNQDYGNPLDWPAIHKRNIEFDFQGKTINRRIKKTENIKNITKKYHTNIFGYLFTIYSIVLARFCRQSQFSIGIPFANRLTAEEMSAIGSFVNTLPVAVEVNIKNDCFSSLLQRNRDIIWEGVAKQRVLFEDIVAQKKISASKSHHPIFQTICVALPSFEKLEREYDIKILNLEFPYSKFDCSLQVTEHEEEIEIGIEYATSVLTNNQSELLIELIVEHLEHYALNDQQALSEYKYKKYDIVDKEMVFNSSHNLVLLIENITENHPHNIAVQDKKESLTYFELKLRSDALASKIYNTTSDEYVTICMDPSCELIISILAVLKAGKAYIPIDPMVPADRLNYILNNSKTNYIISDKDFISDKQIISTRDILPCGYLENINISANNPAYMIYTSGTTGEPKGVSITHHNLIRLFLATEKQFNFNPNDTWCLFHSYGFDVSVWEIFGALLHGGKLVIPEHNITRSPKDFFAFLEKNKVTVLCQTPSALRSLLTTWESCLSNLRLIITAGEALEPVLINNWFDKPNAINTKLINMYGITETTIHNTFYEVKGKENFSVIGKPVVDLGMLLVDQNLTPVPKGFKGEILVFGDGVAHGYFKNKQLSQEKFIKLAEIPNEFCYRSGDLALHNEENEFVYLGRIDRQVQLRGYRIELSEIEAKVFEYCQQQSVACLEIINGESYLLLFIKSEGEIKEIRNSLIQKLPPYMIPNNIYYVNDFPLNSNGKIDIKALMTMKGENKEQPEAILNDIEKEIKNVFEQVLSSKVSNIEQNFFEIGAHSLALVQICAELQKIGYKIEVLDLFQFPTIKSLSSYLMQFDNEHKREQKS